MRKLMVSLVIGLFGGAATPDPVCVDASVDRFEWADDTKDPTHVVLDVREYPSVVLPAALGKGFREGERVELCAVVQGSDMRVYLVKR